MQTTDDARTRAILRLGVQLKTGTAGLDPHDAAVMVVEVDAPDRASWIDLIGEVLLDHPFTHTDGSTCTRIRAIIEADVRMLLRLDEPGAATIGDESHSARVRPVAQVPDLALASYDPDYRSRRSVRR